MYKPNTAHSRVGEGWGLPLMAHTVRLRPSGISNGWEFTRWLIWKDREDLSSKYLKGPDYIILIYLTLHENDKKTSRLAIYSDQLVMLKGSHFWMGFI